MSIQPAKQRVIKDIRNTDVRIQVTGYVKNIIENEQFVLDDKTGEINVNIKNFDFKFKENDLINLIGDVDLSTSGEKFIDAEIIQDMNKLNFEYYQKLYEIKKELDLI